MTRSALGTSVSILVAAALGLAAPLAVAQAPKPPVVQSAVDGILDAFRTKPLVGMFEWHGLAQQADFYIAIVRDPRFARDVGNVVIEGGTALHQDIVDRYINGEAVPYEELRKVGLDGVGQPVPDTSIRPSLYRAIRVVNLTLPPGQRIKVWAPEPPSDWTKIKTRQDFGAILSQRDTHGPEVIRNNILTKGKKALVIYGGAHFTPGQDRSRKTPMPNSEAVLRQFMSGAVSPELVSPEMAASMAANAAKIKADIASVGAIKSMTFLGGDQEGRRDYYNVTYEKMTMDTLVSFDAAGKLNGVRDAAGGIVNVRQNIERTHPDAWFVVAPYMGFENRACQDAFGKSAAWPIRSLVTALRGSTLEPELAKGGCTLRQGWADARAVHGVLYLGPPEGLTATPSFPDPYFAGEYLAEYNRRQQIKGQPPVVPGITISRASPVNFLESRVAAAPPPSDEKRLAAFNANDKNKDGQLDKIEYWEALKVLGYADDLENFFLQRDKNKDYLISLEEYRTAIAQ